MLLVEELPGVGAVEAANTHRGQKLLVEASEVHAMFGAWFRVEWFPVCDAAARLAADGAECLIALDVRGR